MSGPTAEQLAFQAAELCRLAHEDGAIVPLALTSIALSLSAERASVSPLDEAWAAVAAVRPQGWYIQLYDTGDPGPFLPGPGEEFHTARYQATGNLGILSSPPKVHGLSDESPAAALLDLAAKLRVDPNGHENEPWPPGLDPAAVAGDKHWPRHADGTPCVRSRVKP